MNLSADLIIPILETHSELAREKYRKWIISFYPKNLEWTVTDMKDTIAIFQSMDYREDIYDEELSVYDEASSTLLTVEGISNISNYCQYENPTAAKGKWFRYMTIEDENMTQLPDIFSLKTVSKIEEKKETEEATPQGWELSMKKYKITKRIVYTDTKTGVCYNMCITRRSNTSATNMIASGVSSQPILIEYKIECPPELDTKETMVSIVRMLQVIEQNRSPITIDQQKQVLQSYDSLIDKVREKKYFRDSYYLAPKPLTLEQVHLSDAGLTYGQLSILDGYAVTDKADGERMLMYVNDIGESYLINSAFEVRGTGVRAKRDVMYNTLLDGEYLPASKRLDGIERDMFAVFDIYFVGGESVMGLPLVNTGKFDIQEKEVTSAKAKANANTKMTASSYKISGKSRVDIMNSVLVNNLWEHDRDTSLEVVAKKHIAAKGMDMFAACRKILNDATKNGSPYDIDGLIFTPTDLPVLGYYPNKPITIKSASATWDRVLKWKPPEQNSVDFCISIDKNPVRDMRMKGKYAKLLLSCGYSALKNEEISVSRGLKLLQTRMSERDLVDEYVLKSFTPQYKYEQGMEYAYVKYDTDGTIHAENGDVIQDGSIVEFWYDVTDTRSISYRWRALRVRNDKMRNTVTPTAEIQSKKGKYQIKKIKANDWKTATSIWKSIHEPVSKDMITGVERAPQLVKDAVNLQARLLGTDAVYYGRNVTREHLLSVEMLNFHNTVIKDNLYKWPQQIPKNNLLELACGMAGDMNRWRDHITGFSFRNILGVDLVRDNITKAMDGAYARVLKPRYMPTMNKQYQNYVFVIGDCAKPLYNGNASKGIDRDSEDVLMELYGKASTRRILTKIPPFAKYKFDMVSCQFAIHYFFETEEKLKGFMANVRDNLRPGGLFISTFMDGNSVEKLIRDKGKNGLIEGRKMDGKVVVWAIRRILQDTSGGEEPQEEAFRQAEEEDAIENAEIEREPTEMDGGAGRSITKLKAYDPKNNNLKELQLINVPGNGDCMFISLEIAAFGKERSITNDGMWMRTKIIDRMREILSKDDDEAKSLYEDLKMNVDNISPDVKSEAIKLIEKNLYSSDEDDKDEKDYNTKVSGYLSWMSKKGTWGTQIELRMAVDVLKRPVYIYQTDAKTKKGQAHVLGEELYQNKQPVMVWFNGKDHYKALINPEDTNKTEQLVSPVTNKSFASVVSAPAVQKEETSRFGRLIDVYLENTNRLIPEYLVDFNLLYEYATQYGLELVHDGMFSDTYQAFKDKNPNAFPEFDKDLVQQQFSFLNRWVVFRRKA